MRTLWYGETRVQYAQKVKINIQDTTLMGTARHNCTWLAQNHANLLHLMTCLRLNLAHNALIYDRAFKQAYSFAWALQI